MQAGFRLRNARTEKGLSLEQMSAVLKVKVPVLQALEETDTTALPPLCYVRGYLDTYARELGLDPDEIIAEYIPEMTAIAAEQRAARAQADAAAAEAKLQRRYVLREQARIAAERERQAARTARVAAQAALAAKSRIAFISARERVEYWTRWTHRNPALAAAAAVVIAIMFVMLIPTAERAEGTASAPAAATAATTTEAAAPASRSTSQPAAQPPAAASAKPFRVELVTSQPVFVSATADGQSVLSRQLKAGERQVIESTNRFVLRVSDPAAIAWSVDGRPGRTLGKPGQSVTVQMTRATIDQYVAMN